MFKIVCTITSKISGTPKGVYLPITKLHSILAVANLLAHNNISQICYCGQILLQSATVNCSFSDNLTPLGGNIYFARDSTIIFPQVLVWKFVMNHLTSFDYLEDINVEQIAYNDIF